MLLSFSEDHFTYLQNKPKVLFFALLWVALRLKSHSRCWQECIPCVWRNRISHSDDIQDNHVSNWVPILIHSPRQCQEAESTRGSPPAAPFHFRDHPPSQDPGPSHQTGYYQPMNTVLGLPVFAGAPEVPLHLLGLWGLNTSFLPQKQGVLW